jgi:hypothetical protein
VLLEIAGNLCCLYESRDLLKNIKTISPFKTHTLNPPALPLPKAKNKIPTNFVYWELYLKAN